MWCGNKGPAGLILVALLGGWSVADAGTQRFMPVDGVRMANPFPHFAWAESATAFEDVADPVRYEIEIANDAEFREIVDADTVHLNRYLHDEPLEIGRYHWRWRAGQRESIGQAWTPGGSFEIVAADHEVTVDFDPDAADHGEAVAAALARVRELSAGGASVRLVFPAGEYRWSGSPQSAFIELDGVENVVIEGREARVNLLRRDTGFIGLDRCRNVAAMGFEIDYPEERTVLQGRVIEVFPDEDRVRVRLESSSAGYDADYVKRSAQFIVLLDPEIDGRLKTGVTNFFRVDEDIRRGPDATWEFRLTYPKSGAAKEWRVGDRFVHLLRGNAKWGLVDVQDCDTTTFHGIVSRAAGEFQYRGYEGTRLAVLHCGTELADERWLAGNADGVHARANVVGPWIEGCHFQALGDDAVALFARPATIAGVHPGDQENAVICRPDFFNLGVGDEVSFFRPRDGTILLETKVRTVVARSDGTWHVLFEDPIPDDLVIEGDIRDVDQIWNRSRSSGDFVIRNNRFENIRRYGTVFRAWRGVIENNTYIGVSDHAIVTKNGPQWPNGLYSNDIVVRGNAIRECGFEADESASPIAFHFFNRDSEPAASTGSTNVLIEQNEIADCPTPEISLVSAGEVVARENRVIVPDGGKRNFQIKRR